MQTHLDHLLKSAISLEVIRERGYSSLLGKSQLKELKFYTSQRRPPGILIPLYCPDGTPAGYQFRPDNPRLDAGKNRPIKYESIPHQPVHLDMSPRCRAAAGNPSVPIWITEGAKKADALASQGACSLNLTGVWGFKGKNEFGASTLLADFDLIALKGRVAYLVFDSDVISKPPVHQALERLTEHLSRKGAQVKVVQLPSNLLGDKMGVDDFLAQGHSLNDLANLVVDKVEVQEEALALHSPVYCIHDGQFCVIRNIEGIKMKVPLCNFIANIKEQVIEDNGILEDTKFVLGGLLGNKSLPQIQVKASAFPGLSWVTEKWGAQAVVYAGSTVKDHLRTIIQLSSTQNLKTQRIFTHTGWREVDGNRYFLTASGALGNPDIRVSLAPPLNKYELPQLPDEVSPVEAMKASLEFLDFGAFDVQASLWAEMYLAPLCDLLNPAFTLWLIGHTGSFKSVLSALALCHFGDFTYLSLPASWRYTANRLELAMFTLKDLPLVIDDWHPAPTIAGAKELEAKAEVVVRGEGNKSGRGRLTADATPRDIYVPRGLVISTGEQLPGGESHASRLFVVELEKTDVRIDQLNIAQKKAALYKYAMAHYIQWLKADWDDVKKYLLEKWPTWRDKLIEENSHLRLPAAVAWLYAGMEMAFTYAVSIGAVSSSEALEKQERAWEALSHLASLQGERVQQERPALRFLEAFNTLLDQQRILIIHKTFPDLDNVKPGQQFVGWQDTDFYYLLPKAAFGAVFDFCQRSGEPLLFKAAAVWADLLRLGYLQANVDKFYSVVRIGQGREDSVTKRVIQIKKSMLKKEVGSE